MIKNTKEKNESVEPAFIIERYYITLIYVLIID